MLAWRTSLTSAFNGVALMTIRILLQFAIILYSHNTLLCLLKKQIQRMSESEL